MNWTALGALAELIGAIGVIASLIYLATQVRQNAKGIRIAAADAAVKSLMDWVTPLVQNPESWDLFWRGCTNLQSLEPNERARWIPMAFVWLKTVESVFIKAQQGSLDPSLWEGWSVILRSFNSHPGILTYFEERRVAFSPGFVAWMDAASSAGTKELPTMAELTERLSAPSRV